MGRLGLIGAKCGALPSARPADVQDDSEGRPKQSEKGKNRDGEQDVHATD
jgi:hypothetical protein